MKYQVSFQAETWYLHTWKDQRCYIWLHTCNKSRLLQRHHCQSSRNTISEFSTLEEKFHMSMWPCTCNILSIHINKQWLLKKFTNDKWSIAFVELYRDTVFWWCLCHSLASTVLRQTESKLPKNKNTCIFIMVKSFDKSVLFKYWSWTISKTTPSSLGQSVWLKKGLVISKMFHDQPDFPFYFFFLGGGRGGPFSLVLSYCCHCYIYSSLNANVSGNCSQQVTGGRR